MRRLPILAICLALVPVGAHAGDLQLTPEVRASAGPHHFELGFESRYRLESWEAFVSDFDTFHAFRTRVTGTYRYEDRLRLVAQGQHTAVLGLGSDASGAGALYRTSSPSGRADHVTAFDLSQLFVEVVPVSGIWVRVGRELVREGTYVTYPEAPWRFLKARRLSQRLLGTVGWTHGERAYDGVHALVRRGGHALHGFVLEPTTGVFEVEDAYERNRDVLVGGLDYTLERGTWREDTELGAFFVAYRDDRDPDDVVGLFGEIELYTLGARWLGVYPAGPGRVDVLLWGALQLGDYVDAGPSVRRRDQLAGALLAEAGYALPEAPGAPHLRIGVNYASGDADPSDGTRHTFFNLLPTNHGYYGYLDQFAFQNLVDLLVQLRVQPLSWLGLELDYHRFWLAADEDFRWAGSGAFSRRSLGYARNSSRGSRDAGHELDLTATVPVHRTATLTAGWSHLWGGKVFDGADADWLYVQLALRY